MNMFRMVASAVAAVFLSSQVQAQVPDIPSSISGSYTLTYAFASTGSPFTNGTVKTFVLNGATDVMCVDGVSLGTGYFRSGAGSEMLWNGGNGTYYALSLLNSGGFSEINVYSPTDSGNNWKGQFPGPGTFSSSVTCGGTSTGSGGNTTTPALTSDQKAAIDLAATLYPDLFTGAGTVKSAQGYTYQSFASGVSVGFKDGSLYVTGGPFGTAIQNKGTVAAVMTSLQNLKTSVSVTPTADMNNLFTLAAQLYPTLFGGTGTDFQTSADGYLYRYYASSGIYAAIKNGNVYVKGGSYGNAYTSLGALGAVLSKLNTTVNSGSSANTGGSTGIPSGTYKLTVSGSFSLSGPVAISQPFSYSISGIPAPDVSSNGDIRSAFLSSVGSSGVTISNLTYTVKSNTANLVEFDVTVAATVAGLSYNYMLNYKYTK